MKLNVRLLASLLSVVFCSSGLADDSPKKPAPKPKANSAMAKVEDVAGLPRVLLIGDSISIGYTVPVREMLAGKANVHRPLTNCGPTTNGVQNIDDWLGDGKWDVIHFNFGLHDLKYIGPDGKSLVEPNSAGSRQQVPIDEYQKNLRTIVKRLVETKAKLIWRSTTPVPEGASGRVVGDSAKYNAVAQKIMDEYSIPMDDQYAFAIDKLKDIQLPANVHFTPEGSKRLAQQAVSAIEVAISQK